LIPAALKTFLAVLAASASVLGIVYIGLILTVGQAWVDTNAVLVFVNGLYWLLIPPIFAVSISAQKETSGFHSPTIKKILDNGLLLVEPCEWLGHGTGVAVFKVQDDVELFEFAAQVINIQSNKLVQLQPIIQDSVPFDPVKFREIKEKLLIKPGRII
jgi:hypothetical protein